MMPSASQKTLSMTLTANETLLFSLEMVPLKGKLPFHWLVFHFWVVQVKPSFFYRDKAIKEVWIGSKMFQEHGGTLFPLCPHLQGQNQTCVNNVLFEIVYTRYVHFSALWFGNAIPDEHKILHVMVILIIDTR